MASLTLIIITLIQCCNQIPIVSSMASGAPLGSCKTMLPQHNNAKPQTTVSPYQVTFSAKSTVGLEPIDITLSGSVPATKFKGIFIQVRKEGEDKVSGEFDYMGQDGLLQSMDCFGKSKSAATHTSGSDKSKVTVRWTAPNVAGDYYVFYTAVQTKDIFWAFVQHVGRISVTKNLNETDGVIMPNSTRQNLLLEWRRIYKGCGHTKGCFGLPEHCPFTFDFVSDSPKVCYIMVTWMQTSDGKNLFEITGVSGSVSGDGYLAVGLSEDNYMGDDSVVGCTFHSIANSNRIPRAERYYNLNYGEGNEKYTPDPTLGLKPIKAWYTDKHFYCKFEQSNHKISNQVVNFKAKYHLMVARGPSATQRGLGIHLKQEDRAVTEELWSISNYKELYLLRNEWLVQVHGSLMIIAWMVTTFCGRFVARFFRQTLVEKRICGRPFWMVVHVSFMVTTLIFHVVAVGFIVFRIKSLAGGTHAVTGMIVSLLLIPQEIFPLFRNFSWAPDRCVFSWVHYIAGGVLHLAAMLCMFFVPTVSLASIGSTANWIICCISAIVFSALINLEMARHTYKVDGQMNTEFPRAFTLGPMGTNGQPGEAPGTKYRFVILLIYCIGLSSIAAVMILFVVKVF